MEGNTWYSKKNLNSLKAENQNIFHAELDFPEHMKQQYFSKLNQFLNYFGSPNQEGNRLTLCATYLESVHFMISKTRHVMYQVVGCNTYDVANFLSRVCRMAIVSIAHMQPFSEYLQKIYDREDSLILKNYSLLYASCLRLFS